MKTSNSPELGDIQDLGSPLVRIESLRISMDSAGESTRVLNQLGVLYRELGHFRAAEETLRRSLTREPHNTQTLLLLALNLLEWSNGGAALCRAMFDRVTVLEPENAMGWIGLARTLLAQGEYAEAQAHFDRALTLSPENVEALAWKSDALWRLGERAEAREAATRAHRIAPHEYTPLLLLAKLAYRDGDHAASEQRYRQAVSLFPWKSETRWRLGFLLLARGEFRQGREEYDHLKLVAPAITRRADLNRPVWDGRPLTRERLLVFADQGHGDALQLARYLPLIAQRAPSLAVVCQRGLHRLFASLGIDVHDHNDPLPEHDLWTPMLSLPKLFQTDRDTIPASVPYLAASAAAIADWRQRLGKGLKVGLVWAAGPRGDAERNIDLLALKPILTGVGGVRFFSLQVGEARRAIEAHGLGERLDDLSPELTDFHDTAAALDCMDLVITVDTSVAHLSGALGRPTWVLLSPLCGWCWPRHETMTPWYPTARLFWQSENGDWSAVLERVRSELSDFLAQDRARRALEQEGMT